MIRAMTSPAASEFRQFSEGIVRDFLQTIMVVDDLAYFEEREAVSIPTDVAVPGAPPFTKRQKFAADGSQPTEDPNEVESETTIAPVDQKDDAHKLNAKKLIEDFATKGMVCAVIRPRDVEVESLQDKVYPLAENCDIVVFDWVLYGATDGGKVKELITEITKRSSDKVKRLRLIVVYTGQEELAAIANDIKSALELNGLSPEKGKNDYTLEAGPVRIAVYAKAHASIAAVNTDLAARIVPIDKMPDKLVAEFTEMTMGLVSNVAIGSMAALRSNTHRVLTKFHSGLDAPFLAHRAMLPHPEDANNLLVYLIGEELTAVLEGHEIADLADQYDGLDIIKTWVEMHESEMAETKERGFAKKFSITNSPEFTNELIGLLREGFKRKPLLEGLKVLKDAPHKGQLTRKLARSTSPANKLQEEANALEYEFAALTTLKSNYRVEKPPILLPGTILKELPAGDNIAGHGGFWVCIQPSCDCVRMEEPRSFLFLRLAPDEGRFDLVLRDKGDFRKLRVVYRQYKSKSVEFAPFPDGSEAVRGIRENNEIYLTSTNATRYSWMAELKFEHAQRIINKYAAVQSRVGLDESEWLRRWAGDNDEGE